MPLLTELKAEAYGPRLDACAALDGTSRGASTDMPLP
jgi:hypothetical protein